MKPEDGTDGFLGQVMRPIVASDMEQFMTGNRGLGLRVHGQEPLGQENHWRRETEIDGRIYIGGKAELGAGPQLSAHLFESRGRFSRK